MKFSSSTKNTGPITAARWLRLNVVLLGLVLLVSPARSESIPGWGLGLSFVRRICQQHGGQVQLSSNETSGTSFAFILPRGAWQVSEVAL